MLKRVDSFSAQKIKTPNGKQWGWIIVGDGGEPFDFVPSTWDDSYENDLGHEALAGHPNYGAVPVATIELAVPMRDYRNYATMQRTDLVFKQISTKKHEKMMASYVNS